MRQLFVGITGEREAATMMDGVVGELRAAGATVVDVAIPDLDAEYRNARGSAPGSLKAGWTAYLTRGAAAGEKVLTIEELIASGRALTRDKIQNHPDRRYRHRRGRGIAGDSTPGPGQGPRKRCRVAAAG